MPTDPVLGPPLLTIEDVVERLNMSERWVNEQVAAGNLASFKLGRKRRFEPAEVDRFLETLRDGGR